MVNCPVCCHPTQDFGRSEMLNRHLANYRRCLSCDFVFVENPFWLKEVYDVPLTASDVGGVARSLCFARTVRAIIEVFFDHQGPFVDYGGGSGLLTRLMRDDGYDFYWSDIHCPNLYADGFVADMSGNKRYELLTAAEVFEHLPDPMATISELMAVTDNLLIMTQLLPEPPPRPGTWWYYGPEHGQHISFFARKTLAFMAKAHGLHHVTNGVNLHLFSKRPLSPTWFRIASCRPFALLLTALCRRPSLLPADFAGQRGESQR